MCIGMLALFAIMAIVGVVLIVAVGVVYKRRLNQQGHEAINDQLLEGNNNHA
jgi:uncharacterized membrane protein